MRVFSLIIGEMALADSIGNIFVDLLQWDRDVKAGRAREIKVR